MWSKWQNKKCSSSLKNLKLEKKNDLNNKVVYEIAEISGYKWSTPHPSTSITFDSACQESNFNLRRLSDSEREILKVFRAHGQLLLDLTKIQQHNYS